MEEVSTMAPCLGIEFDVEAVMLHIFGPEELEDRNVVHEIEKEYAADWMTPETKSRPKKWGSPLLEDDAVSMGFGDVPLFPLQLEERKKEKDM
eukprot:6277605-Karenia_brevis.AAC.1